MYCTKCGQELKSGEKYCSACGEPAFPEVRYCSNCGEKLDLSMVDCPRCGYHTPPIQPQRIKPKSRVLAGVLGILLGSLGVHNFYLGNTSKGFIQLMMSVFGFMTLGITSMISEVWGFVEGVLILVGNINEDGDGNSLE